VDTDGAAKETSRLGWLTVLVAAVVAVVLALVAPDDWDAGPASIEVVYGGDRAEVPVALGDTDPVEERTVVAGATVDIAAPDGLGLDEPIRLTVSVDDPAGSPGPGDVEVAFRFDDGTRERLPVYDGDGGDYRAERRPPTNVGPLLAILGIAIVLWVTEAVPLFVTSLAIPVAVAVTDVGSAQAALAPFFDPIIVLFLGGFLLAEAMRSVGLDRLAAATIVDLAGRGSRRLYVTLIGVAAAASMFMSNTAAVALLLPIVMAVTEPLGSRSYRKAVVLGIAYASTIGGVGSAIGTPANLLAIDFVEELTGRRISFAEWFRFGLPMVIVFLPIMAAYLWKIHRVDVAPERFAGARETARAEREAAGGLTGPQIEVLVVFGGVVALWLTQSFHELHPGIVALAGVVVLGARGRIGADDLARISWPTLLTFGGGLTIGRFMVTTGASDWLVTRLDGLDRLPEPLAVTAVALVALLLTTVASNTASAATLIPLSVPLAASLGVEPVLLVAVVAVATSIDFALVIGTPPTMLAFSTELFTVREILRKGALLDVIGIAVLVGVAVPIWRAIGVV
jgi:sodium-dependent dicarboxylate transporter 2/3/5